MTDPNKPAKHRHMIDETGKQVSVVLPIQADEDVLEDVADLAAITERRNEETIDHADLVRRLKADGIL